MVGVGDYELQEPIGAGVSGTVWRARRRGPVPQVVAVKRLSVTLTETGTGTGTAAGTAPESLARLRREAVVLTELDHPHVVRVLEVVPDGDGVAICMQYAPGGSLQGRLAARGRLAPGEVVAVLAPIAEALASAHRRGIVHGDVKPANILFTSDGEPLLGDFGVAHVRGDAAGASDSASGSGRGTGSHAGRTVTGTAQYLAPELLHGAPPDPRSDVYALAAVCYEALTGRPPHDAPTPDAVLQAAEAAAHEPLTRRSDIPGPLAAVVEHALARDPNQRIATADVFADGLRAALPRQEIRLPRPERGAVVGAAGLVGAAGATGMAGVTDAAPSTAGAHGGTGGGACGQGGGLDDPTRSTRTFGPRPPRPAPPPARRPGRLPVTLVVGLAAAGVLYLARGPLSSGEDCPEAVEPTAGPGAQVVAGDPEGDGCPTYGVYQARTLAGGQQAMVLTIQVGGERQSIGLGQPGDQLLLGDWDCDGIETPGLYRPVPGEVQYFGTWPEEENRSYPPERTEAAPPAGRAAVRPGTPGVAGDGSHCDRIEVTTGTET